MPSNSSTTTEEALQQPSELQNTMIHAMTNKQLQMIMMAALRAVNGDKKNIKTPEQKQFSGQAKDLANFLQECDLRFKVFPTTYSSATKKVFYALSLMTSGITKVWKDTFINDWKGQADLCPGNDWAQFKTLLEGSFADPGRSKDVMQQLQTIRQGKEPIDVMNTRFHLLLSKAGINVTHNIPLLIQLYGKTINLNIYCQIILNGTVPNTLDAYMFSINSWQSLQQVSRAPLQAIKKRKEESPISDGNCCQVLKENQRTLTWFLQTSLTRSVSTVEGLDISQNIIDSWKKRSVSIVKNLDTMQMNAVRNWTMVHQDKISRKENGDSSSNWKVPQKWKLISMQ